MTEESIFLVIKFLKDWEQSVVSGYGLYLRDVTELWECEAPSGLEPMSTDSPLGRVEACKSWISRQYIFSLGSNTRELQSFD